MYALVSRYILLVLLLFLGSVSNGAEIISNDSIHVYGNLRGRALAGARGNQDARIFVDISRLN